MSLPEDLSTMKKYEGSQLKNLLINGKQADKKTFSNDGKPTKVEDNNQTTTSKHTILELVPTLEKDLGKVSLIKKRSFEDHFCGGYKRLRVETVNESSASSSSKLKEVLLSRPDKLSTDVSHNNPEATVSQNSLKSSPNCSNHQSETHSSEGGNESPNEIYPLNYGEDILPQDCSNISDRLKQQNVFSFNLWLDWAKERNLKNEAFEGEQSAPLDVGRASDEELNFWFDRFLQEKLPDDSEVFALYTLKQILSGLQGYLRKHAGRPDISFIKTIKSMIKNISKEKQESKPETEKKKRSKKASSKEKKPSFKVILSGQFCDHNFPTEPKLLLLKHFNEDSSFDLFRAVLYHCIVTFNLKSINDHLQLKLSDFRTGHSNGRYYVEFVPRRNQSISDCESQVESTALRVYNDRSEEMPAAGLLGRYMDLLSGEDLGYERDDHGAFYRVWKSSNDQLINEPLDRMTLTSYFHELSEVSKIFVEKQPSSETGKLVSPLTSQPTNVMVRPQLRAPLKWLNVSGSSDQSNDEDSIYSIYLIKQTIDEMLQSGIEFNRQLRENMIKKSRKEEEEAPPCSLPDDD